jgi:parallel beta-helix repeat protein
MGIGIMESYDNIITDNVVKQTSLCNAFEGVIMGGAVSLVGSSNSVVARNTMADNKRGIEVTGYSSSNRIYHNNFVNNTKHFYVGDELANSWDDGYPSGGNYWSDYNDSDVYSGPCQNETGSDGIGDTPLTLKTNNLDNYPLMNPYWNPADVNRDLRVDIKDVLAVSRALGSCPSDPKWNPLCDVNNDLKVDIKDYYIVCKNYGKTYP